ncbi:hypothetical protein [Enterovirga rhinocerotis]|uniref:Uncharacterized protein n=1 Tax=Enterovirga rhinocerotis TaxID=1339210 RepID=A0A4R7C1F7_9HYPH|nr:hypothetical protein [Enterovirga rhinocerotis]TDR90337.1 hypothetical protein EV668_3188 [Enterovirga rhinocerotis]
MTSLTPNQDAGRNAVLPDHIRREMEKSGADGAIARIIVEIQVGVRSAFLAEFDRATPIDAIIEGMRQGLGNALASVVSNSFEGDLEQAAQDFAAGVTRHALRSLNCESEKLVVPVTPVARA